MVDNMEDFVCYSGIVRGIYFIYLLLYSTFSSTYYSVNNKKKYA